MSDLLPMKRPEVFQGIPDKIDLTVLEAALSAVKTPKPGGRSIPAASGACVSPRNTEPRSVPFKSP